MNLTPAEIRFLTALAREPNQTGYKGPAHDLLRNHACPEAPWTGPNSLAFSYEAVPLTALLLKDLKDLQEIDDFLRKEPTLGKEAPAPDADGQISQSFPGPSSSNPCEPSRPVGVPA